MSRALDRALLQHEAMPNVNGDPIVESGSNSDGEWTRWADGTMECWGIATISNVRITTSSGVVYRGVASDGVINLPVMFFGSIKDYVASCQVGGTSFQHDATNMIGIQQVEAETMEEIRVIPTSGVSETLTITYQFRANGRWK